MIEQKNIYTTASSSMYHCVATTTHIACLSTISSRNVEGWNAKNFAAYTADHIFNHKKML